MSKRFTETGKWADPWFRKLPMNAKLFWLYVCDNCDQAGVMDPDWEAMSFYFKCDVAKEILSHFEKQIEMMPNGKLFIRGFIKFQYGKLSPMCKPHAPVYAALDKHGISEDGVLQNDRFKDKVDSRLREKIIARDGLICAYTQKTLELWEAEIDHIHPRSLGGTIDPSNLVVCHVDVNRKKKDKTLEQFCQEEGLEIKVIKERLRIATSKPIKAYTKGFESLQEKDKDKEEEKEWENGSPEGKRGTPPCTVEQAKAAAPNSGLTAEEAEHWWTSRSSDKWMKGADGNRRPVGTEWQFDMKAFINSVRKNGGGVRGKPDASERDISDWHKPKN